MLRHHSIRALAALSVQPVDYVGQDGQYHPEVGGGGGGAGAVAPMARVRYVDGDVAGVTGANGASVVGGSSGGPFASLSALFASVGVSTSVADANTNLTAYLAPAKSGYADAPVVPSYRSVSINGLQTNAAFVGPLPSLQINAVAGDGAVPGTGGQIVALGSIEVAGAVDVNSDGSGPGVQLILDGAAIGSLDGSSEGFTGLLILNSDNAVIGQTLCQNAGINVEGSVFFGSDVSCQSVQQFGGEFVCLGTFTAADSIVLFTESPFSTFGGNVQCDSDFNSLFGALIGAVTWHNTNTQGGTTFETCHFNGTTFNDANIAFRNCTFDLGSTPVFTNTAGYVLRFDAASLASLYDTGAFGLTFPSDVVVMVDGGFRGGPIEQPTLMGDQDYSFSLNGSGATAGFTSGANLFRVDPATALSAPRSVNLLAGGAEVGDTIRVSAPVFNAGGHGYTIIDNHGQPMGQISGLVPQSQECMWDGSTWVPIEGNLSTVP